VPKTSASCPPSSMGTVGAVFIICNLFGLLNCCLAIMVSIFGLTDVNHPIKWRSHHSDCGCNPWLTNLNPAFAIAIFCVWLICLSIIGIISEFMLLVFMRNYIVHRIFSFLKYLEGHALFYMVLGVLCLGISGNSGILIGSYIMVIGLLMLIVALLVRVISGSSAGRGQYGLFRLSKSSKSTGEQ